MTRILAIANQKGGVGKTTTTVNLAAALAERGLTVLVLDWDPQGNASTGFGIDPEARQNTAYDLLVGDKAFPELIATPRERISIIPANQDLASAEVELASQPDRSARLRRKLVDLTHDFVLIDCPPALGLLTLNALVAADGVLVPLQSEFYALEGLSQLLATIKQVRVTANPDLSLEGIVLTMFDKRNNLSQQVERDVREHLGDLVYATVIPRNVRVSEAPSHAMPVLEYDPGSKGAEAYRALAAELLERNRYELA